jgi:hypothetical protein
MNKVATIVGTLIVTAAAMAATPSSKASSKVGSVATICGTVASVYTARRSRGRPTFLDFDAPYPNQDFEVIVWGDEAGAFGSLHAFGGHRACATGLVRSYRGIPEIVVRSAHDLRLEK